MRYTIITPTVLRPELIRACESVNTQTCTDWEHLIVIDGVDGDIPKEILHPRRKVLRCSVQHNDYGNTCRYEAWTQAVGDYIYYLDDDNYLADVNVLDTLKAVKEKWAIFPIFKQEWGGVHFFCPPLRHCTDGGSILVQREVGRVLEHPSNPVGADTEYVESMASRYPYQALFCRALMIYTGRHTYQG